MSSSSVAKEKAEAARIVFGAALMGEEEEEDDDPKEEGALLDSSSSSLVYSVSPAARKSAGKTTRPFSSALSSSSPRNNQYQHESSFSSKSSTSNSVTSSTRLSNGSNSGNRKEEPGGLLQRLNHTSRDQRCKVSMGPFDKILAAETEAHKQSTSLNGGGGKENDDTGDKKIAAAASSSLARHPHHNRPERSRQAQQQRRNLYQQTQRAIDQASESVNASTNGSQGSVNQSLQRAMQAKNQNLKYKRQQTARYKHELQQEREAATAFHQQSGDDRLKFLHLKSDLISNAGRQKALQEKTRKHEALVAIDEESEFKSSVYRDHQDTLLQEKAYRRRMSTAARAKVRQNHREGEEQLRLQRIEEDHAVLDERCASSLAKRETDRTLAEQRRDSFRFRNNDARRIREEHAALQNQRSVEEHESYELKWESERDANEYKKQQEEQRRQSLMARGETFVKQREQVLLCQEQEKDAEHESYELKWAGEKDAEQYQREMEKQRRKSLAFRNKDASRRRELEARQREEESDAEKQSFHLKFSGDRDADAYKRRMEEERRASLRARNLYESEWRQQQSQKEAERLGEEHDSYELKWDGERDAEQYKREMEQQRRDSLARRNKEKADHVTVMDELRMIAREKEAEAFVDKWAGEEDAKAYLRKLEEERRKSLQLRGKQIVHHRQIESEQRDEELKSAQEDEALRSGSQKDVEAYKEQCAARDRTSLQYRRKEAHMQRLEEDLRQQEERELDSANFQLETLARTDVEDYIQSCKQRRRLSLAFRAKEKRRHADWRKHDAEQEREARSRDVRDRMNDMRHVELARHQERAQQAMDAIRNAGCSFNPFMGVL